MEWRETREIEEGKRVSRQRVEEDRKRGSMLGREHPTDRSIATCIPIRRPSVSLDSCAASSRDSNYD